MNAGHYHQALQKDCSSAASASSCSVGLLSTLLPLVVDGVGLCWVPLAQGLANMVLLEVGVAINRLPFMNAGAVFDVVGSIVLAPRLKPPLFIPPANGVIHWVSVFASAVDQTEAMSCGVQQSFPPAKCAVCNIGGDWLLKPA